MPLADKINPAHAALIVIDMQKEFAAPDGKLAQRGRDLSMVPPLLTALQKTINTAKAAGVPVLYTKQVYDRSQLSPLQLEQYDLDGKFITCDVREDGHNFYGVTPPAGDVFEKYNYNIFSNPAFGARLEKLNIKTLVIAGMDTIYCVETAIRNAFDLGYKVVVPRDLVAGNAKHHDLHDHTLRMVEKTYGVLTTSAEISAIWNANA